jgi:internalin A
METSVSHEVVMADQIKRVSRPRRRFLRFSVRGLIVLVLLIGVWLGWLVRSARIQREAVEAIEHAGGWVEYDDEWHTSKSVPGGKRVKRTSLVELIGIDYFSRVTSVVFVPPATAANRDFAQVGRLNWLKHLIVHLPSFGDAELKHIEGLANLTELGLGCTQVTDDGLVHLERLTQLAELELTATQVSDAGLAHLKGLKGLNLLLLDGSDVSNAGVELLRQALPRLSIHWIHPLK